MQWELAWSGPLVVREVALTLPVQRPWRLAYLSDLHYLPWCSSLLVQLESALRRSAPDALLWGGDLVDLPWGLAGLERWLCTLPWPQYAVLGNHDRWCGARRVRRGLASLRWLDLEPVHLEGGLRLCGRVGQGATSTSLLVGHEPTAVKQAARAGFPVMLAGHLHGCQWIWYRRGELDYPGGWFFGYHGEQFQVEGTRLWVSRGVNDTLPARINCPRDIVMLQVTPG